MTQTYEPGHKERLRARLADTPNALADREILDLLLGHVLQGRDTALIADQLFNRFESLRGVLEARPAEYLDIPGLGKNSVIFFDLLREFLSRYAETPSRTRAILCSPESVAAMARERLGNLPHEEVWLAYVDRSSRLISWERASKGSVDASSVYPRDIIERALALKAKNFILVHNHPGGNPEPSKADIEFTQNLHQAAQMFRIRFVDHVVVTESQSYSLMSKRLL